jgi:hypothetical protein
MNVKFSSLRKTSVLDSKQERVLRKAIGETATRWLTISKLSFKVFIMSEIIRYHFGIDVAGILSWPQSEFESFFQWLRRTSKWQVTDSVAFRKLLEEAAVAGHTVIPIGMCTNWDFHKGCRGHQR